MKKHILCRDESMCKGTDSRSFHKMQGGAVYVAMGRWEWS